MSISLKKGDNVYLTKNGEGSQSIIVGLGWREVEQSKPRGVTAKLLSYFEDPKPDIDCDAIAVICGEDGKCSGKNDMVYFSNLNHISGCVTHLGDNMTGIGDGDDEQITINLKDIPDNYSKIVLAINIYRSKERKQNLGMLREAYIRIIAEDTSEEICRFEMPEDCSQKTAMIFGELFRDNGEWCFAALGEGTDDKNITELSLRYKAKE